MTTPKIGVSLHHQYSDKITYRRCGELKMITLKLNMKQMAACLSAFEGVFTGTFAALSYARQNTYNSALRAKRLFREVDERSKTGKEELLSVSHLTGVTPRRLKNVTMFMAESNVGHKVCRPGNLVINTWCAWMAALGFTRQTKSLPA